ncbi:unnamed protein product [Rotaria sp. Silwood2]|nr:unnamed protein product [Rotaria sp. Silwood2]CAF4527089.1 unnamed protein product [Rotaria sp. Silwood2]
MTSRNDLDLEQKVKLIKDKENGMSVRELKDKFYVSIGSVSNILKRKNEYLDDDECNKNKKMKRKTNNDLNRQISDGVYEWFVLQRSKRIPISGPILQAYAQKIAGELCDTGAFRASSGWLDRFKSRYNVQFRMICGEAAAVNHDVIEDWTSRLPIILEGYNECDVYNCDETGLFFKLIPDRSFVIGTDDCKGGKRSKERYTVLLCTNWTGTHKLKPVVIGKSARPRCFKRLDVKKLPVTWFYNRTAWMNSVIFSKWLYGFDIMMQKQNRKILLFLDNAPVHPPDIQLNNITLKFFPANTTAKSQPLDQGSIRAFKAHYRKQLVQHIIANASSAYSVEDIKINALDAIWWIDGAWKSVTEATIQNTFKSAGFKTSIPTSNATSTTTPENENIILVDSSLTELGKALQQITIGGDVMSANDFVSIDDDVPTFNIWDDNVEKILTSDGFSSEDVVPEDDAVVEEPPSLLEAIKMIRGLHLLSTVEYPELHSYIVQLQSKLMDIYLDGNNSKQTTLYEYFQRV